MPPARCTPRDRKRGTAGKSLQRKGLQRLASVHDDASQTGRRRFGHRCGLTIWQNPYQSGRDFF